MHPVSHIRFRDHAENENLPDSKRNHRLNTHEININNILEKPFQELGVNSVLQIDSNKRKSSRLSSSEKGNKKFRNVVQACEKYNVEFSVFKEIMFGKSDKKMNEVPTIKLAAVLNAVKKNDSGMLRVLKELGADLNEATSFGDTPMSVAMLENQTDIIKLLETLNSDGNNQDLPKEIVRRKFLSQVWGLKGKSPIIDKSRNCKIIIDLEGIQRPYITKNLSSYINDFFNVIDSKSHSKISKIIKKEIIDAITNAFPLSKINIDENISKINMGKPFVIFGGSKEHAISIIICKNRLIVFNRGLGGSSKSAEIYVLPSSGITKEIFEDLTIEYPDIHCFNRMIKAMNLKSVGGFTQKDSKVGNCTWASAKGAFRCLLILFTNKKYAKEIYKEFSAFARKKSLEDYFENSPEYAEDILQKINRKLKKKSGLLSSKALLKKYFSKST